MTNQLDLTDPTTTVVPKTQLAAATPAGLAITQSVRLSQTQAEMFSRVQLALLMPRNWIEIGPKLLQRCEDPVFAKKAYYRKPMAGEKAAEGLSIRFAEEVQTLMRNVAIDLSPEMEDELSAHYRMTLIDLEGNAPESETFKVDKTVERRKVPEGNTVISQRVNSSGEIVYLVPATEDQFNSKLRARKSIVKRGLILAKVPIDLRERCLQRCMEVAKKDDAKDPHAATKDIITAFLSIGVETTDLKDYLGHSPASLAPAELEDLRSIYVLIRDGELIWPDVLEAKREGAPKGSKKEFVEGKKKQRAQRQAQGSGGGVSRGAGKGSRGKTQEPPAATGAATGEGATAPATDAAAAPADPPERRTRASRHDHDDDNTTGS